MEWPAYMNARIFFEPVTQTANSNVILLPHLNVRRTAPPQLCEITRHEFLEYLLVIKLNNYSERNNAVLC